MKWSSIIFIAATLFSLTAFTATENLSYTFPRSNVDSALGYTPSNSGKHGDSTCLHAANGSLHQKSLQLTRKSRNYRNKRAVK